MDNNGILRIIDANSNRAREGARVVEDIARFILMDDGLAARWKQVRHSVSILSGRLEKGCVTCRDSLNDPGRFIDSEGEKTRTDYRAIARANAKRTQEAVRVLEEFSKLLQPDDGGKFKELRFRVYILEKETLSALELKNGNR